MMDNKKEISSGSLMDGMVDTEIGPSISLTTGLIKKTAQKCGTMANGTITAVGGAISLSAEIMPTSEKPI